MLLFNKALNSYRVPLSCFMIENVLFECRDLQRLSEPQLYFCAYGKR